MRCNQITRSGSDAEPNLTKIVRPTPLVLSRSALALTLLIGSQLAFSDTKAATNDVDQSDPIVWLKPIDGATSTLCTGIAATPSGPVVIGQFAHSVVAGDRVTTKGYGGSDGFVASYSTDGLVRWITPIGGVRDDSLRAIAADAQGNVYVSGYISGAEVGASDLDAVPVAEAASGADAILVKLSAKGKRLWSRRVSGVNADRGSAITVAKDGTVFWGGQFQKSATMPGFSDLGTLESEGGSDAFVAAFEASGQPRWFKALGGKQDDTLSSLASDGTGGVVLAGTYEGILPIRYPDSLDLLRAAGGSDIFIARLGGNGDIQWAHSLSGKQHEYPVALRSDGSRAWLVGNFQSQLRVDAATVLESEGVFDGFVSSWSMDGKLLWAKRFGGTSNDTVQSMTLSGDGVLTVAGSFLGDFDLGDDTAKFKTAQLRPFIARLDANGHWINASALNSKDPADAFGVASGPSSDIYLCGVGEGDLDFSGQVEAKDDDADHERSDHGVERDRKDGGAHGDEEEENEKSTAFIARIHTNLEHQ